MNKTPPNKSSYVYTNARGERINITPAEQAVFATFRQFLMTPNRMLCFYGPVLEQNQAALKRMTELELLVKETFKGAYSLTSSGYHAMKACAR